MPRPLTSRLHSTAALAILASALFASRAPAQGATTEGAAPGCPAGGSPQPLTVVVSDEAGGRVPGATVAARCGTEVRGEVLSGNDGTATLQLVPGGYRVVVAKAPLKPAEAGATVGTDGPATLTVVLRVAGHRESVTVYGEPARRSRTATKTDTPLLETPQSITVITAEQIREQASPNLQEVVRYAAGVRNEAYGIDNRGDWIFLRGSDDTTTLIDGLRLPLAGWWGVVRVEPEAYERIEVLRGPSSIIAGQNDPGGVVSLVSKRPQAVTSRNVGLSFGSYDRREIHADLTGPLAAGSPWSYRLVGVARDGNTQVQYADEKRLFLAPSLTWRSEARAVTAFAEYQYDRSKNTNAFLGREGTLEPAPHGPIPTDVFIGEPDWDRYGGTRWRFGYAAEFSLGHGWQLRQQTRRDQVDGVLKTMYAAWWDGFVGADGNPDPGGRHLNRWLYGNDDSVNVTTGELLVQGNWSGGGVQHTTLFGVDGMLHDFSQSGVDGRATPLDVYAPVYGSVPEPSIDNASPDESKIRRLGFLVQDQAKLFGRLSLRAGVRRDRVRNEVVGGETARDSATSLNFGLVYQVQPWLAPYASYSESFNPVGGTDAAGAAFEPKRGRQVEAGLKWEAPSSRFSGSAAYYTLVEKNRLTDDPEHFGYSVQIGEARIRGVELEGRGSLGRWNALASYTYTRARATAAGFGGNLDPDQQLEGVPEHQASLWTTRDLGDLGLTGVQVGGGVRRVGRIGDGTGEVFVPAVTIFDVMASLRRGRWRASLNANNVADKSYIATCLARGDCWFGQRRLLTATLGVDF